MQELAAKGIALPEDAKRLGVGECSGALDFDAVADVAVNIIVEQCATLDRNASYMHVRDGASPCGHQPCPNPQPCMALMPGNEGPARDDGTEHVTAGSGHRTRLQQPFCPRSAERVPVPHGPIPQGDEGVSG